MKITKGKIFKVILLLLVGFLAYQFIYGRLIMFSPIVVGFEKQKAENSIVYYHENNTRVDNKTLDSLILKTEQFHKLEFNQKVRIFFCNTDKEFKRYTGSSARMVTIFGILFLYQVRRLRKEKLTKSVLTLIYCTSYLIY
jgi:hypothetical protein